jgi:hypothetical protein
MSTKHTPGPWEVVIDGTCSAGWPHVVQEAFADDLGYAVAELPSCFTEKSTRGAPGTYQEKPSRFRKTDDHDEIMANARLIAAAPELLEALRKYLAAGFGNSTDHHHKQAEAYDTAIAAIAKATGEQV